MSTTTKASPKGNGADKATEAAEATPFIVPTVETLAEEYRIAPETARHLLDRANTRPGSQDYASEDDFRKAISDAAQRALRFSAGEMFALLKPETDKRIGRPRSIAAIDLEDPDAERVFGLVRDYVERVESWRSRLMDLYCRLNDLGYAFPDRNIRLYIDGAEFVLPDGTRTFNGRALVAFRGPVMAKANKARLKAE